MTDSDLEQQLRTVLHEEGDQLPFTVDIGRVEAGLAAQQRSSRNLRLGLLAAGIGIVAFGLVGIGHIRQPENAGVGAHPSPSPSPSAHPGTPFAIDMLEAPPGEVMVDRSTPNRTPTGTGGAVHSETIGSVSPALQHGIAAICLGEGDLQLSFGQPDTPDHVYTTTVPCDGVAYDDGLTSEFEGSRDVIVDADEHAAWRVIVTGHGDGGAVLPATLRAGAAGADRSHDVEAALACGYWLPPEPDQCDVFAWPPVIEPTLRLSADDDLLLSIGNGWDFAPVEVSAIPADAELRSIEDLTVPMYSGSPGSGRIQIPVHLDPGTWFVHVVTTAAEHGGDHQFYADWNVRVDVAP
jgi:hypothetical protein